MKVSFEAVMNGLNKYISKEIYGNLNELQELVARVVVGRINNNANMIKNTLMTNGFAKTLCIVDHEGMVEADQLLQEIKKEIERQGSIVVEIPLIGKLTFKPQDADVLYNEIVGGANNENNQRTF